MGPKGVAVDKNGHIIAVDNKACCVFIFQSNGKLVTKFGARGTSDRQFAGTQEECSRNCIMSSSFNIAVVLTKFQHVMVVCVFLELWKRSQFNQIIFSSQALFDCSSNISF